ncbi:MAG: nickel-dependent hydrogenase large subunit [Chloroflexota bacterium]
MSEMTIPIGPQHPLLKEPISVSLDVSGERIVRARISTGYVHRGLERLAERRTYEQNVVVVECICGICSHVHTMAYCQAIEALAGIEAPERAKYIRVLLCELERIHSHLLWMGVLAEAIGFTAIFMYAWREREAILDIMEEISGGRIAHGANVIGGVCADISADKAAHSLARLRTFRQEMELFMDVLERDRSFRRRTQGIGVLAAEMARTFGQVGPPARASGIDVDMRRDAPYAAYPRLAFDVITATAGDVWSRAQVRMREIIQSLYLCHQVIQSLPEGPLAARSPRRVPPGEVTMRCEAPRGELFYYVRAEGGPSPARLKVRTPSVPQFVALEHTLPGLETADFAAVIAGADLCIACADR